MRLALLVPIAALWLAGCAPGVAVRPSAPLIVTRTQYIHIPAELLVRCRQPTPAIHTWGDLAQAYLTLRAALAGCAAQVDGIAKMQPK